jgi:hypothetical protein
MFTQPPDPSRLTVSARRPAGSRLAAELAALFPAAGVTFTVTLTGGQIPLGRPIPRADLPQHVRVKRGHGSARMKKSCVIPPC